MNVATPVTVAAGMTTGLMSTEPYTSPEYFQLERERIFRRCWLVLCRVEEIPSPRDFVLKDVEICNSQFVVARQKDGSVRAFHNVCPHRNNQVVQHRKGNAPAFVCNYHSWSFGIDGALRAATDRESFFDIDDKKCGMKNVATDIWNGFVFVNLEPEPSVSLKEFLGAMGERMDGIYFPFASTPLVMEATLESNWKTVADAFSEGYHVTSIHPETIGESVVQEGNRWAHPDEFRFEGPHHSFSLSGNLNYVPPPRTVGT